MNQKLFVGNLSYSSSEDELRELFSQAGTVSSAQIINDKFSGRSKGFGFIEMSTPEEAQKAVEMFNGHDLGGRKLTVNEAQPLQPRPPKREFQR
ncbi:RNA-binding protein [Candidatus Wolfebacteria bacterium RIFCSPHIGHO2_01_FULL_48_22]|uniref:RNA-binding protein n=2 Tax=Candidatus Wolfeibacteriota TaxID=1752735 RepID=A0A1F8DT67_9BACT|nr:MAG: RNA-binding protein [Candidatus Wolfebacteria bacterium RIFCSPHIGHO2_01_FULL_48_22]OGM93751.1 MAG: RNA-binding protein [Candidatus Wolfebacteria bacterium RIFCSPLOWO2_01_FULL_47_17b]